MSDEDLPVVLVSATDISTAEKIISDLTENVDRPVLSEYVWELNNKYYSARVRLRAASSPSAPAPMPVVEGHLVYFAADECNSEMLLSRLSEASCSGVRLALCACAEEGLDGALRRVAADERVELVAMEGGGGDEGEQGGISRVREALHAHVWPGLQTHHDFIRPVTGEESDDSAGEEEEEEELDEAECVRRAELLARALGAAGGLRGEPGGERGERLARAEQLLAAFCTALGTDINKL